VHRQGRGSTASQYCAPWGWGRCIPMCVDKGRNGAGMHTYMKHVEAHAVIHQCSMTRKGSPMRFYVATGFRGARGYRSDCNSCAACSQIAAAVPLHDCSRSCAVHSRVARTVWASCLLRTCTTLKKRTSGCHTGACPSAGSTSMSNRRLARPNRPSSTLRGWHGWRGVVEARAGSGAWG
jgi:hypothetical protein